MINVAFNKIKSNLKITLINTISVSLACIIIIVLFSYLSTNKKMLNLEIEYNNSVVFFGDANINNILSETAIGKINNEYENIIFLSNMELSITPSGYSMNVLAITDNFIDVGVPSRNFDYSINTVEDIRLLYGNVWLENSSEKVVVVDEDTANNTFGYTNVVGRYLPIKGDDFLIIGVVSNTTYRQQLIQRCETVNEFCMTGDYSSTVYIPYYFYTLTDAYQTYKFEGFIFKLSSNQSYEDVQTFFADTLSLNNQQLQGLQFKEKEINRLIGESDLFNQIIISVSAVILALGLMNFINTISFTLYSDHRQLGIYKTLGANKRHLILISFYEGIWTGIISSLITFVSSFVILIISLIYMKLLKYLDIFAFLKISFMIMLAIIALYGLINVIFTLSIIRKDVMYFFRKGEEYAQTN